MTTNKSALKYRSITYPNHEKQYQNSSSVGACSNRGKLKRMDSIDSDQISSGSSQQLLQQSRNFHHLPHQSQSVTSYRSLSKRRDLSLEGRLRTQHFHQTHSGSSLQTPSHKLLRFSDGSIGGPASASSQVGLDNSVRSSSCLPLSRQRANPSPLSLTGNIDRFVDWPNQSIESNSFSPFKTVDPQDRHEYSTPTNSSMTKATRMARLAERKLNRYHSTDSSEAGAPRVNVTEPSATGTSVSTAPTETDARSRRSQFRRAISLFSLSCDKETERERKEKTPQKILRPPTRHVYRRGVSGLPIECSSRSIGMVY